MKLGKENVSLFPRVLSEKGNKKRDKKILMDLRRTFQPPVDQTARIISGLSSEMMFSDYMLCLVNPFKYQNPPVQ